MASLKTLLKDTAIYGISSIIGRFLNYLLVPLYAYSLKSTGEYGIVTNIYAWTGLLLVVLTYGMETSFFRFANKENTDIKLLYSTILRSVLFSSVLFVALVFFFLDPISQYLGYAEHSSYVWVMAVTVAIDAFQSIAFAYLRYKAKAVKFALAKLSFIAISISLNLLVYLFFPFLCRQYPQIFSSLSLANPSISYIFYINLLCTFLLNLLLLKELRLIRYGFDFSLLKELLYYALPILILGVAGILNQTVDKIMFPKLYTKADAKSLLGIYGYVSKIAAIMLIITQAFRYAYEPFVFDNARKKDSKDYYSKAMKYYLICTLLSFLLVMANLEIIKYLIPQDSWQGLKVVPVLMLTQIVIGVYFNLSFWYKLIDKTLWGAFFSVLACLVLVLLNILFVPMYGYMACAFASLFSYTIAMLLSYFIGQRYYPVSYALKDLAQYLLLALVLFLLMDQALIVLTRYCSLVLNNCLILLFVLFVLYKERLLYFRRKSS